MHRMANIARRTLTALAVSFAIVFAVCTFTLFSFAPKTAAAADTSQDYIEIQDIEFVYDGTQKAFPDNQITVVIAGEETLDYTVGYAKDGQPLEDLPVTAGVYDVTVTANEGALSASATLTINRRAVDIILTGNLEQTYSMFSPLIAKATGLYGEEIQTLTIIYPFEGLNPSVGDYQIVATFEGNENYLPRTLTAMLTVKPKPINISFSQSWQYTYDGREYKRSFSTDLPNGSVNLQILYNNAPFAKNVGIYDITISIDNPNYEIGTVVGGNQLQILKRTLVVALNDIVILKGATPIFTYRYLNFAENENAAFLEALPYIKNPPTEPGEYTLTPEGAASQNYNISYQPGKLTINYTELNSSISEEELFILFSGSFSPNSSLTSYIIEKDSEAYQEIYSVLKERKQIIFTSDIEKAYVMRFENGGLSGATQFQYTVTNIKLSPLFVKSIGVIDKNGNFYKIDKYTYKNGILTFTSYSDGMVVIYRNGLLTYAIIGVLGLIILIVIVLKISDSKSYKKVKKEGLIPPKPEKKKAKTYDW